MQAKSGLWANVLLLGWRLRAFESMTGFVLVMFAATAIDECFRVLLLRGNRERTAATVRVHASEIAAAADAIAPPNGGSTSVPPPSPN